MNTHLDELINRWHEGQLSDDELRLLTDALATQEGRAAVRGDWFLEAALPEALRTAPVLKLAKKMNSMATPQARRWTGWLSWRPLTAAAAGIVFGMFCTSVVYGFVAQQAGAVKKTPLAVFDPGLENTAPITEHGVPHRVGEWGADSARVVTAESGVEPLQGQHMLRLEPIPREKEVMDHSSRAYQMVDLQSLAESSRLAGTEVQVKASFFATKSEVSSRYSIRIFALDEVPEQARKNFWPKTQGDGVVIVAQRFDTSPGDRRWHNFSLKMPLPRGARTLVFILAAVAPEDASANASVHYLDDVQVSLLTPQATRL